MKKNEYTKKYDITIIGGGLTGKLMLSLLQIAKYLIKINCVGLMQIMKILKM